MGAVYRVFDELVGEDVALKVLADANHAAAERFRAEVRLARRITHRNVGRTYDIGTDQGVLFITMELIEGHTVLDLIQRGPSPETAVAWVAAEAVAGLVAAHGADVVHRDLKPTNLLVSRDGRVLVIDWGVATIRDADGQGVAGTPDYMAPEQLRGAAPAPAQDIYSMGLVMFELLAGQRPFQGTTATERARARLDREPSFSLLPKDGALPPIVRRCLALVPASRPSTAELLSLLQTQRAEVARPPAPTPVVSRDASEPPTRVDPPGPMAMGSLSQPAMMAFLSGVTLMRSPAREWLAAYGAFRRCIELEPSFLQGVAACALAAVYVQVYSNQTERSATELADAVALARTRAPDWADTQLALGLSHMREARFAEGIRHLNEALRIDPRHARAHEHLGRIECEAGLADRGVHRVLSAVALDPSLRGVLSLVGRAHALRGRVELFDEALAFAATMGPPTFEEAVIQARVACWWGAKPRAERLVNQLATMEARTLIPYRIAESIARVTLDHGELWELRQLLGRGALSPRLSISRMQTFAEVEGAVGDPLRALTLLEQADQAGLIDIEWLAHCPALDVVRDEPRFERVLLNVHARAQSLWTAPGHEPPALG